MKKLNCPNCGAPITGDKCEYCGTVFRKQINAEEQSVEIIYDKTFAATSTGLFQVNEMRRMRGLLPVIQQSGVE